MKKKGKFPHLLASKWTAIQAFLGWRHFVIRNRQVHQGAVFAELQTVCHPETRMWINAKSLKNRDFWQPGWLEIPTVETDQTQPETESFTAVR